MMAREVRVQAVRFVLVLACFAWAARAQQNIDFSKIVIKTTQVSDGLYVLEGAGGNITVFAGSDGVLLVDAQYAPLHQKILDAVAKISNQPIRFLINTHWHGDHTSGNELMAKAGVVLIAHENVAKRLREGRPAAGAAPGVPPAPKDAIPVITYTDSLTLRFNGDEISVIHPEPAHTDGDSIVYFRRANVIATGDIPAAIRYGNIDIASGGSINGNIAALERFLRMGDANTRFIPGHGGPISTKKDVQEQRDMLVAVRDKVQNAIRAGKTLPEIIASKPTAEFDEKRKGAGNPDQFVTLIYNDLSRK